MSRERKAGSVERFPTVFTGGSKLGAQSNKADNPHMGFRALPSGPPVSLWVQSQCALDRDVRGSLHTTPTAVAGVIPPEVGIISPEVGVISPEVGVLPAEVCAISLEVGVTGTVWIKSLKFGPCHHHSVTEPQKFDVPQTRQRSHVESKIGAAGPEMTCVCEPEVAVASGARHDDAGARAFEGL